MSRKVRGWRLAALCLLATGWWRGTDAWGPAGHERIAQIAKDILREKDRKKVKSYLHGDIVELAGWEKTMTSKFRETDSLHWHRQEPEWTCGTYSPAITTNANSNPSNVLHTALDQLVKSIGDKTGHIKCDGQGAENGSLFCALAFFFNQFSHSALLSEFPKPKEPINAPESLPALATLTSVEQKPSHYLRWLVILVGDLHQPLHWLREHEYGRQVKVEYKGLQYSLLDFWEDYLPKNLPPQPNQETLDREYSNRAPAWWDTLPTELFRIWAKETAGVVCKEVYEAINTTQAKPQNRTNTTSPAVYKLSEDVYQKWVKLAQEFTTLGGERVAYVLHEIIEHKKHKAHAKEGRGRHHRRRSWWKCLGINAVIAAFIAPLLMAALRWHDRAGGPGLVWLARKHLKM